MALIGVSYPNHRTAPLQGIREFAGMLEASGVVDQFWVWDELTGWAPVGFGGPDPHSTHDPFIECAFALAHSEKLGARMTTDAVRSQPAELARRLLSLASATEGTVTVTIGMGEARHMKPFGHPTGQGPSRLEDILRATRLFIDSDQPFSYEGKRWTIDNGYLGAFKPRKPELWVLGGGPKLTDLAATYADGLDAALPNVVPTVDRFVARIAEVREKVEAAGRDPEAFGFGVWLATGLHEDPEVIAAAQANPLVKWYAACYGRLNQEDWAAEGLERAWPPGWHYGSSYMPFTMEPSVPDEVVSRVSPEMVAKGVHWGTVEDAAETGRALIEAGATFVGVLDLMPLHTGEEGYPASIGRVLDVCGRLKTGRT